MTDLENMTHNDLANLGTAIFEELNRRSAEHNRKAAEARRLGMGWLKPVGIDDDAHIALLDAIVSWDEDPKGSLETMRQDNGYYAEWNGRWPAASDAEYDFATSRGVS